MGGLKPKPSQEVVHLGCKPLSALRILLNEFYPNLPTDPAGEGARLSIAYWPVRSRSWAPTFSHLRDEARSKRIPFFVVLGKVQRINGEITMALESGAKKIEHNGPKRGRGAWCRKADAKQASRKRRRALSKRLSKDGV